MARYTPPPVSRNDQQPSDKLFADLRALRSHLLLPIEEIRSMRWIQDRKLLGILLLGLFPIAADSLFPNQPETMYWCLGFYFSVLWALFFYRFFSPEGATRSNAVICFVGTAVVSMALLLFVLGLGLESFRDPLVSSTNTLVSLPACILTIGVPEEFCKALVILYLLRTGPAIFSLPTMVFYGLMSGLGFGIHEGMTYQMNQNFSAMNNAPNAEIGMAHYYFQNMLRLTTLPFLHATWTAIGAYFWSLGYLYPARRYGLWAAALGIPAILHGFYDNWCDSMPFVGLAVAFVSVCALMMYLSRGQELEKVLQEETGIIPEGITHRR